MDIKFGTIELSIQEKKDLSNILGKILKSHKFNERHIRGWLNAFAKYGLSGNPSIINSLTWVNTNRGFNACYFMQLNWLYHVIRYLKDKGEWEYGSAIYKELTNKFNKALNQVNHCAVFEHDGVEKLAISEKEFKRKKEYYLSIYKKITENLDF